MEIKDIIRKRREELNLTYEQLGKIVGVGKSTVRKWETGMIENMRRDNIVALSKALNISPSVLMGLDTENDIVVNDVKSIIKGFKENEELINNSLSHGKESFKNFTDYLYSTFTNELDALGENFIAIDLLTLYEYINKIISFELNKITEHKKATSNSKDNVTELITTPKQDEEFRPLTSLDSFKTVAAHYDELIPEEIAEADKRILEDINKRRFQEFKNKKR